MTVTTNFFYPAGYVLISEQVANNSTSIDFNNFNAGGYFAYRLCIDNYAPTVDNNNLNMRVSNNTAGAPWDAGANNYYWARRIMDNGGFSTVSQATAGRSATLMEISSSCGNAAGRNHNAILSFYIPAANSVSPIHWSTWQVGQASWNGSYCAGMRNALNFISMQFFFTSGNIAKGKFALYGLKV
jgi:hypothetical protein